MLYEKLAGFDIGLWDRSILTSESKETFRSGIEFRKSIED
jgi:hypothetical protein